MRFVHGVSLTEIPGVLAIVVTTGALAIVFQIPRADFFALPLEVAA